MFITFEGEAKSLPSKRGITHDRTVLISTDVSEMPPKSPEAHDQYQRGQKLNKGVSALSDRWVPSQITGC